MERCAITCRAAPSFIRVGQVELFSRRLEESGSLRAREELERLLRHALEREFPAVASAHGHRPFGRQLLEMLRAFSVRMARLAVEWLRVGFVQVGACGKSSPKRTATLAESVRF